MAFVYKSQNPHTSAEAWSSAGDPHVHTGSFQK